ncbi:MAG: hypothetical protein V1659_03265 [Candidatus Woesearchaeota archaeon]
MFTFKNSIGAFVIEGGKLSQEFLFDSQENIDKKEKEFISKGIPAANEKQKHQALQLICDKKYFELLKSRCLDFTIEKISGAVSNDNFIIQSINNIEELHKILNVMVKRLREWFGYYIPEIVEATDDNEAFVSLVLNNTKTQLSEKFNIQKSMGGSFSKEDINMMLDLALRIKGMFELRDSLTEYMEQIMKKHCPNMLALTGAGIGAKLLEQAGSLERLSTMPSSTIQVLGAEKALFRHLKTGSRPPKHGFLINHPLVIKARDREKGRVARTLADKISMAIKVDYFKGEFIGDKLREELEKRFL